MEPGCTAPACWSRTRNHAADEIPLQRRPPPEAKAFAFVLALQRQTHAPFNWKKAQDTVYARARDNGLAALGQWQGD